MFDYGRKGKKQLILIRKRKQKNRFNKFGTFTIHVNKKKVCKRKSDKIEFSAKLISLSIIKRKLNNPNIQHNNRYGNNKLVVL
jgi:hypothetical protein